MPVPEYQDLMLPLLQIAADGKTRHRREFAADLAEYLHLTKDQLAELMPASGKPVFSKRASWAIGHLYRAGLLIRPTRAHYQISDRGREVLAENPDKLDNNYLARFEEFRAYWKRGSSKREEQEVYATQNDATPEETLEAAYQQIRSDLALELLDQVKSSSPQFFERLVVELLVSMGYGGSMRDAGMALGKSGDEGIDGTIKEDRLGLDVIYLQAKRWEGTVGRPEIQKFVGALHGKHAKKGVFLTTGTYAKSAIDYASAIDPKVVLIDGERLAEYMIDFGIGVSTKATYQVKRIDSDYFNEE